MTETPRIFVSNERQVWMRLVSHTAVFDRDPQFERYRKDPSGSILRILHVWLADGSGTGGAGDIRHYLGSVRRCSCGGWSSRVELARLFRRATAVAALTGESSRGFRNRLTRYLRDYFRSTPPSRRME